VYLCNLPFFSSLLTIAVITPDSAAVQELNVQNKKFNSRAFLSSKIFNSQQLSVLFPIFFVELLFLTNAEVSL